MRRSEAEQLARAVAENPDILEGWIAAALSEQQEAAADRVEARPDEPQPIQIWRPETSDGRLVFTRPEPGPLGDHFAVRRTIPAKKPAGTTRVCYFGESAANGYLLAPTITPAGRLESFLNSANTGQTCEVIDFSRTNETLNGMALAVQSSLQLDPDILVIFAGNNWNLLETQEISPFQTDCLHRNVFGKTLGEKGLFGPIEAAMQLRVDRVVDFLTQTAVHAQENGLEVIIVIPEINLGDWDVDQPVAWLPGISTHCWHIELKRARAALQAEDWAAAFKAGERMLALDEGSNPTAYQVIARAMQAMGDLQKARLAAQAAVDSSHHAWMYCLHAPRITTFDRVLLQRSSEFHGFSIVNLPELFQEWTGDPLPGRRMFLDYCHFTPEGVDLAAAGIAEKICGRRWEDMMAERRKGYTDNPETLGTAFLGAAIHSAHRMPRSSTREKLLVYWIKQALDASPAVESAVWNLVEARAAGPTTVLTSAHSRNYRASSPLQYAHGWDFPHLDFALIRAIKYVLGSKDHQLAERVDKILLSTRPAPGTPIELTDPYHLAEPLERPFPDLAFTSPQAAPLRACWPTSRFVFIADGHHGIQLEVCVRQSEAAAQPGLNGRVVLEINEKPVGEVPLEAHWEVSRFEIEPVKLMKGLNELVLHWPDLEKNGSQMRQEAVKRLQQGQKAECFPVFGEIFSLKIREKAAT